MDNSINGCYSNDQSVFINGALCFGLANIPGGLFAKGTRGLMLQNLLQCWDRSPVLSITVAND